MPTVNIVHQYWFCHPVTWLKLLTQNRGVHFRYIGKVCFITLISLISFPLQLLNMAVTWWKGRYIPQSEDPVFIIGHWRSGTTFLHYLLASDERFGYLTYFHAFIPNLAIIGEHIIKRILGFLTPKTRPQDNINISMDLPTEEENPLATFSVCSASHSFFFPKNESYYRKYELFEGITNKEKNQWQKAYKSLLRRISIHQKGKQLLIKNPHNTGRITELLELYPKARFIHIYRNPYDIFPSTFLMYDRVIKTQFLQHFNKKDIEDKILYYYASMMRKFYTCKDKIPESQLIEIKFEDFEKNPMSELENIYEKFNLKFAPKTVAKMNALIEKEKGYIKNKHQISDELKSRINEKWGFSFETLGYPLL